MILDSMILGAMILDSSMMLAFQVFAVSIACFLVLRVCSSVLQVLPVRHVFSRCSRLGFSSRYFSDFVARLALAAFNLLFWVYCLSSLPNPVLFLRFMRRM